LNEEEELGISYYKQATTYQDTGCYDQAIHYAQLAKKNLKDPGLLEENMIVYLNSLTKMSRFDEANDALTEFSTPIYS
jgi:tetratricopeptide (TPR) repeat protein